MSWSYGSVGAVQGWVLTVNGHNEFPTGSYYSAPRDAHDNGVGGTPWPTTGIFPTDYFTTFFYNETNFSLEIAGGLELIHEAALAASRYASRDTNPNRTRDLIYATRVLSNFIEYAVGPSAGLYAMYSYIIVDPYSGGSGGPVLPPAFQPPPPVPTDGPIRGTKPPPQIPPDDHPPPPPPTRPPAIPIPGETGLDFGMKFPCVNDDGLLTMVDDPEDCPTVTPLSDAIDDIPIDIIEIPTDGEGDTGDGQLVTWQPAYPAGIDRPNAIFAWDRAPRNLSGIDSLDNGQETINEIVAVGAQVDGVNLTVTVRDQDSIDAIGRYWVSENFSFATDIATLTAMANARLRKYRMGAHVVTFDPAPGAPSLPIPWADFDVSDTVRVKASSKLRGGLDPTVWTIFGHTLDTQRVNGWDLELDDDTDAEKLTKVYTEEDLG